MRKWQIKHGPDRLDFTIAYMRGEEVSLIIANDEFPRETTMIALITSATPRVAPHMVGPRNNWIIEGTLREYKDSLLVLYFYGVYDIELREGVMQEGNKEEYESRILQEEL